MMSECGGPDAATWKQLAKNSFEASFASEAEKAGWVERVEVWFGQGREAC